MSRRFAGSIVLLACALASRGVAGPLEDPPDRIGLRVAARGVVEACADCVLVEFREGSTRTAYFVRAEPDCVLRADELVMTRAGSVPAGSFLEVEYHPQVQRRLDSCLGSPRDVYVMASVDGVPSGVAFYRGASPSLNLVGDRGLARLREMLERGSDTVIVSERVRLPRDAELSGDSLVVLHEVPEDVEGFVHQVDCNVIDAPIFADGGRLAVQLYAASPGEPPRALCSLTLEEPRPNSRKFRDRLPLRAGDVITFSCRSFRHDRTRVQGDGCSVDVELRLRLRPKPVS